MKELLAPFPSSYHTHKTVWRREEMASMECPQCGTAINDDCHFCAECGGELTVCSSCKSVNVVYARFCHMCGQPMMVASAPNKITKIITWEARDFAILDRAVLAIIKLRGGPLSISGTGAALGVSPEEITDSIERLELAHRIERVESTGD
jgi:hypothetical protein